MSLPTISPDQAKRLLEEGAAVPLFVGGGLMNAGITGFCGMARLLVHIPWNRATYHSKAAHA